MHVVLWDSRAGGISKDFAGGYGVGNYHGGGGLPGRLIRWFSARDRRPPALAFAYLAAIFRQAGHTVEYCVDRLPPSADLVVFHPALVTLAHERSMMARVLAGSPAPAVWVVGPLAAALEDAFAGLDVTLVRGEPEQLFGRMEDVLAAGPGAIDIGEVACLDDLPRPEWDLFAPRRLRVSYDFWKFPTAFTQLSRGCSLRCNYCPYIARSRKVRFREPESVLDEIRHGMRRHGFRSYKFRDPLFGLDHGRVYRLAELLVGLPNRPQFSIESRIDLLPRELLAVLKRAGLTSITFGIETPDEATLRSYERAPIADDRQRQFVERCRELGIRTVAGFMLGFPHDTPASIRAVSRYARLLNPTFANFNLVTPYPGTRFFDETRAKIATFDYSRYDVYTPVLEYEHLTATELKRLHAKSFVGYYFRRDYLQANTRLLWPKLLRADRSAAVADDNHMPVPRPMYAGRELELQIPGLARPGDEREVRR